MFKKILTAAALLWCASSSAQVQVFPFPEQIRYSHHSDDFTVRVRTPGGVWQDLYLSLIHISEPTRPY